MSGAGRKHRAKKLTEDFLGDTWNACLAEDEELGIVKASSGGKQLSVEFPVDGALATVNIPGKFNKVVWLLRNDVVVVASRAILVRKLTVGQLETLAATNEVAAELLALNSREKAEDGIDAILENPNRVRYGSRRRVSDSDEEKSTEEEESVDSEEADCEENDGV